MKSKAKELQTMISSLQSKQKQINIEDLSTLNEDELKDLLINLKNTHRILELANNILADRSDNYGSNKLYT